MPDLIEFDEKAAERVRADHVERLGRLIADVQKWRARWEDTPLGALTELGPDTVTGLTLGSILAPNLLVYVKDPSDLDEVNRVAYIVGSVAHHLVMLAQEGVTIDAMIKSLAAAMERIVANANALASVPTSDDEG